MRDEFLNENIFLTLRELRTKLESWRIDYNTQRPHSSLNYRTPAEFLAARMNEKALEKLSLGVV